DPAHRRPRRGRRRRRRRPSARHRPAPRKAARRGNRSRPRQWLEGRRQRVMRIAMSDRARALQLLRRIQRESAFAPPLLASESGFVRTLVLGVLRWRSRLDHAIAQFASRKVDPLVTDVLRLGAFQLLFDDVPPYAAVAETVTLAPK